MKQDFHMHTFLSDGTPSPEELIRACLELQLDEVSITDHDSIGAYPAVLDAVKGTNLRVLPGAELDAIYRDVEIHMLGIGLDIQNRILNQHLANIQAARKTRAEQQAEAINRFHGREIINLKEIFSRCQTFMNPHLIHSMINQGLFDEFHPSDRYKEAARWMKQNIQVAAVIQKPSAEVIINMIHAAGGVAVLAHPAYYLKDGFDLHRIVGDLTEMGLDGLEVNYPYFQEGSREFPTLAEEKEAIAMLKEMCARYSLKETTGSDAHQLHQLIAFHSRS